MRIVIETEEAKKPVIEPDGTPSGEIQEGAAPPPEVAARAAAIGALSAGPAPPEAAADAPESFIPDPATPETAPENERAGLGMSAGAAPDFATGALKVETAEEVEALTAPEGEQAEGHDAEQ